MTAWTRAVPPHATSGANLVDFQNVAPAGSRGSSRTEHSMCTGGDEEELFVIAHLASYK